MIELRDLSIEIGGRPLLRHVDATVGAGTFVALLGPNGVGKTTLLRALIGLHPHPAGAIEIDGTAVERFDAITRARHVAFVTSDDALTDALRVRDVVATGRYPHHRWWEWNESAADEAAISSALEAVGMSDYADRFFATLSSGERQRAWIAMGLAQETPVLLLDEPTSHLDIRVAHQILALLRDLARQGKTVLSVLHDVNEAAAYADRIMLLGRGSLLAYDRPNVVLATDSIEEAYGIAMDRVQLPGGGVRVFARGSS